MSITSGIRSGLNPSLLVTPSQDASSGKYVPASAAEWEALPAGEVTP